MAQIDLNRIVDGIQDEIKLVTATLKDKGGNRFGRALLVALAAPAAAYVLAYAPAQSRLARVDGQLQVARNTAKHADAYKDLKDRLTLAYMQLPLPKDRESFLSDAVKDALRAENIVPINFMPPVEVETPGGMVQSQGITMRVKFSELMAFLDRLESNKRLIHINNVELRKTTPVGTNEVNCGMSTIFMTERY